MYHDSKRRVVHVKLPMPRQSTPVQTTEKAAQHVTQKCLGDAGRVVKTNLTPLRTPLQTQSRAIHHKRRTQRSSVAPPACRSPAFPISAARCVSNVTCAKGAQVMRDAMRHCVVFIPGVDDDEMLRGRARERAWAWRPCCCVRWHRQRGEEIVRTMTALCDLRSGNDDCGSFLKNWRGGAASRHDDPGASYDEGVWSPAATTTPGRRMTSCIDMALRFTR